MSFPNQELRTIAEQLRTQDNAITENPIFMVQQRRRLYGYNSDEYSQEGCSSGVQWFNDDNDEASESQHKQLQKYWREHHDEPDGWRRVGFIDLWENAQPFLTRCAADRYITENRHNLRAPRVFVESGYRNKEWAFLRDFIQSLAELPRLRCSCGQADVAGPAHGADCPLRGHP